MSLSTPTIKTFITISGWPKVDILPPHGLYHPVLPHRHQGKLTFPLCQACMEEEMTKPLLEKSHLCRHTPEQRTLRGEWCTPEIQKAVELGYTLIKIHEVYHFPPERRQVGLFAEYVNTWLKIKQESAGYPAWAVTPTDKAHYVHQYQQRENINLDPNLIVKNPGRKATAKLMLNSFWGKFGENLQQTHHRSCLHGASSLRPGIEPLQRHTSSPTLQRQHTRSGLCQPGRESTR